MYYIYNYNDLQEKFEQYFPMPPEELVGKEIEYRCPYRDKCEAKAQCFIVTTPTPLEDNVLLNVKCRLILNKKIPVYARDAIVKK